MTEEERKKREAETIAAQNKRDAAMLNDPNARRATLGTAVVEKSKPKQPVEPSRAKKFWRGLMRMMNRG